MPLAKITKADEKRITKDWQQLIPSLGIYKNMRLMNRLGPLLVGICLEKNSGNDAYNPIFHVHNLCIESPEITLTLAMEIENNYVNLSWHEKKCRELAEKIKSEMAIIPLDGSVNLSTIINGYKKYINNARVPFQQYLFEDIILISAWCCSKREVESGLDYARDNISKWPEYIKEKIGGLDKWITEIKKKTENLEALQLIYERQISELKVEKLPVREIIVE